MMTTRWILIISLGASMLLGACTSTRSAGRKAPEYNSRSMARMDASYIRVDLSILDTLAFAEAEASTGALSEKDISQVIETALTYMGTPYKFGGMSTNGLDCSGLVNLAFQSIGRSMPRTSRQLADLGKNIRRERVRKGDLVFFSSNNGNTINHVGLITRIRPGHYFIHATTSRGVREDDLNGDYWRERFRKAIRL